MSDFCFDGDRAGKQAAWRALENALPQIREGRQVRFVFLPEGHDPDSYRQRTRFRCVHRRPWKTVSPSRIPDSRSLRRRSIWTRSTAGRASPNWRARWVAKIPPGVYRELLIEALADTVGCRPQNSIVCSEVSKGGAARGWHLVRGCDGAGAVPASTGRPSVVRRAITSAAESPEAATEARH